jgi:hypothetical protein
MTRDIKLYTNYIIGAPPLKKRVRKGVPCFGVVRLGLVGKSHRRDGYGLV